MRISNRSTSAALVLAILAAFPAVGTAIAVVWGMATGYWD